MTERADGITYRVGRHWQAGVQNAAGSGEVTHTDYIHPLYGYSRFDGAVPEALCLQKAKQSHERRGLINP